MALGPTLAWGLSVTCGLAAAACGGAATARPPAAPSPEPAPAAASAREADTAAVARAPSGRWVRGEGEWVWVSEPLREGAVVVMAVPDAAADGAARDGADGAAGRGDEGAPTGDPPPPAAPDARLPPPAPRPGDLVLEAGTR